MRNRFPVYCKDCGRVVSAGHGELRMASSADTVDYYGNVVHHYGTRYYVTCRQQPQVAQAEEVASGQAVSS